MLAKQHPNADLFALYVDSLNQMIDLEDARDLAVNARIPWTISFLLVMIALVAVGISGYATGLGGVRLPVMVVLLPALIALANAIIGDLDRSRAGYIATGDMPMMRLERSLDAGRAAQRP